MASKAHLKNTTAKFRNRRHLIRPVLKPTLSPLPVDGVEEVESVVVEAFETETPEITSLTETETPMITAELKEELSSIQEMSRPKSKPRHKKKAALRPVPDAPDAHFLKQLALELGVQAQRLNIFSAPVDREHITVIPVSQVFYGITGENVRKKTPLDPWGAGALHASPLGYIEIKNGRTEFRKIPSRGMGALLPLLLKSGSFLVLMLRRLYENYLSKEN
jgi:hypothetical protein